MEVIFFSFPLGWGNKQTTLLQDSFIEQSYGSSRDSTFNEMCAFTCKNALRMHMPGYKQRAENLCDQQVYN